MTTSADRYSDISLRDRLRALMVFRVALVTIFLGGTLAVDVQTLASLSDPRNLALLSLIVVTYGLTIVYALLLDDGPPRSTLARFQIAGDFAITAILVLLTNGLESIFLFLFYLNIINTAIVAGRTAALYAAGAVSALLLVFGTLAWVDVSGPLVDLKRPAPANPPIFFQIAVDTIAAFLIALLSGRLAARLGETTVELEQKRVDLAKLRALTQNILASLDSGVVTVDENGTIIYTNAAAASIAARDRGDLDGRSIEEIFPAIADTLDDFREGSETGASARSDSRFEVEYERPDGETIFLGYSVSILRDAANQPNGHVVVFQDLTEIKRLQAEKEQSQRLAAIGELAASIAHEIRNPLASISGSVEMLEAVGDFDGEAADLMEIVVDEVDRLDRLISEFLEYSRPTELTPESADLRELVADVVDVFEQRGDADRLEVSLETEAGVDDWSADVDRESIRQILWNLLNNAVEALDADTDSAPDGDGPDVRVSLASGGEAGDFIDIVVEDAGPGVDDEHAERLFDPFYTTKEDGSGLGLATSHRLAQKHGGRLRLAEPGELGGARFVVRLPTEFDPADAPTDSGGLADDSSTPTLVDVEPATSPSSPAESQ